jgi:hypothetical protein
MKINNLLKRDVKTFILLNKQTKLKVKEWQVKKWVTARQSDDRDNVTSKRVLPSTVDKVNV